MLFWGKMQADICGFPKNKVIHAMKKFEGFSRKRKPTFLWLEISKNKVIHAMKKFEGFSRKRKLTFVARDFQK